MSVITELECDVCHTRSADVKGWMEIGEVFVRLMVSPEAAGLYIIEHDNAVGDHVCGQKCYHEWHAQKLAEFYDPTKKAREDVAGMVEQFEVGYGCTAIDGALAVKVVQGEGR